MRLARRIASISIAEGVGEIPEAQARRQVALSRQEPGLICLADALVVNRSRRVENDRVARFAHRLAPAPWTQSSTSFEVEDCKAALSYAFFFLGLVFFAVFFAAVFVFVFRFFAMLPS